MNLLHDSPTLLRTLLVGGCKLVTDRVPIGIPVEY